MIRTVMTEELFAKLNSGEKKYNHQLGTSLKKFNNLIKRNPTFDKKKSRLVSVLGRNSGILKIDNDTYIYRDSKMEIVFTLGENEKNEKTAIIVDVTPKTKKSQHKRIFG